MACEGRGCGEGEAEIVIPGKEPQKGEAQILADFGCCRKAAGRSPSLVRDSELAAEPGGSRRAEYSSLFFYFLEGPGDFPLMGGCLPKAYLARTD